MMTTQQVPTTSQSVLTEHPQPGSYELCKLWSAGDLVKRVQESSGKDGWPPMLLIQGTADTMDMAQALRAVEADVRLLFLEGHYHQFQLNAPVSDAIATFLRKFTD
eukprot:s476_g4.t1